MEIRLQGQPITDGILQILQGVDGLFTECSEAVSRAMTQAVHDARHGGLPRESAIGGITRGAMEALAEAGKDTAVAVKGIVVGVLLGTRETGAQALQRISETARTVIHETLRNSGDLMEASRGLLKGAVHSAHLLGLEAGDAAALAAGAAIEEAGEWSADASHAVRISIADSPLSYP